MIPIDPNNDGTKGLKTHLRKAEPNPAILWPDRVPATIHSLVLNEKELDTRLKALEAVELPFPFRGSS
jgi:hypothetical protein